MWVMIESLAPLVEQLKPVFTQPSSQTGAQLLLGYRGRPRLDVEAAARALGALSQLAAARPEIAEIEINPLLVLDRGILALDARLTIRLAPAKLTALEGR